MEQKRRKIHTGGKRKKWKTAVMIIGIVIALVLIFWAAYKLSYGFFSSVSPGEAIIGTEDDISGMPREELEAKYLELKEELEEKEEEIEALKEMLKKESDSEEDSKEDKEEIKEEETNQQTTTPPATEKPADTNTTQGTPAPSGNDTVSETQQNTAPPPPPSFPSDDLITPEELEKAAQGANQ